MKEFIISASVWDKNFQWKINFNPKNVSEWYVAYWPRHSHCYEALRLIYTLNWLEKINHNNVIQGFITSDNRFVDRKEWYLIAKEAKQTTNMIRKEIEWEVLFSEDLY